MLPRDSEARKGVPIFTGFIMYFPDAIIEGAKLSIYGNDKHNPGEPLHWSEDKSNDHGDCILRHQMEYDQIDPDCNLFHATHVFWRAGAQLQTLINKTRNDNV